MAALLNEESSTIDDSKPYPFFLAYALEGGPETLGDPEEMVGGMEMGWYPRAGDQEGMDSSLSGAAGKNSITDKFPEITTMLTFLPDGCAIDGEILAYDLLNRPPFTFPGIADTHRQKERHLKTICRKPP